MLWHWFGNYFIFMGARQQLSGWLNSHGEGEGGKCAAEQFVNAESLQDYVFIYLKEKYPAEYYKWPGFSLSTHK